MPKAMWLGVLLFFAVEPTIHETSPQTFLWAGPAILISAMLIAWAAESSQFFIAQGFALAILAWMQTLPEFAVEAVLAWHRQLPYLFANLTGALRLLTGLGWPMIYCAAALKHRKQQHQPMDKITLHGEHAVQVMGLLVALSYVSIVLLKGSLNLIDAVILIAIYCAYLAVLQKMPPKEHEGIDELERVPRAIVLAPRGRRIAAISVLFVLGGGMIYLSAEPFLGSLFAVAVRVGIPSFVFIQWIAPFLSEFPEFLSTFYWARTVKRAPMALMNMVSSNVNQWTLLVAMLPIVVSMSMGTATSLPLDDQQRIEVAMTIGQQLVGLLLLMNMELKWWEAGTLFVMWFVQFVLSAIPAVSSAVHVWITVAYFVWAGWELLLLLTRRRQASAFTEFTKLWRQHVSK